MEACYSTRDGHTLAMGYMRFESETHNLPVDIVQLCISFFGDFSHLIGESQPAHESTIKNGMWILTTNDEIGTGFPALVHDIHISTGETDSNESDSDSEEDSKAWTMKEALSTVRAGWEVDSYCKIYSKSRKVWSLGRIFEVYTDEYGEWLVVAYNVQNGEPQTLKEVKRWGQYIEPIDTSHTLEIPFINECVEDVLPVFVSECFMQEQEYRLVEFKPDQGVAVLALEGSLTMQVPVPECEENIDILRDLRNTEQIVMVTVLSGPRSTKDGVELVQCVTEAWPLADSESIDSFVHQVEASLTAPDTDEFFASVMDEVEKQYKDPEDDFS